MLMLQAAVWDVVDHIQLCSHRRKDSIHQIHFIANHCTSYTTTWLPAVCRRQCRVDRIACRHLCWRHPVCLMKLMLKIMTGTHCSDVKHGCIVYPVLVTGADVFCFQLHCCFSASGAYSIDEWCCVCVDMCRRTFFKLLLLYLFLRFSRNLAHMFYVPIHKKLWNRFSKFCFWNFWQIFKILHQRLSSLGRQGSSSLRLVFFWISLGFWGLSWSLLVRYVSTIAKELAQKTLQRRPLASPWGCFLKDRGV